MSSFIDFLAHVLSAKLTLLIVISVCTLVFYKLIFLKYNPGKLIQQYRWRKRCDLSIWQIVFAIIFTAITFIPITLVAGLLVFLIGGSQHQTTRWESRTEIVALQDNVTSTGRITTYLGSGGGDIGGSMTYYYAIPAEGGIKVIPLTSPNIIIKEVPGVTGGYLLSSGKEERQIAEKRYWRYSVSGSATPYRYPADKFVFIVPPGTIDYKFKVDLK